MNNNDNIKIGLTPELDANNISFTIKADTDMPEELIRINPDGFFWKGKLVEEDHEIYLRFKEWMDYVYKELVENNKIKENEG